jgi:hypothetical protein
MKKIVIIIVALSLASAVAFGANPNKACFDRALTNYANALKSDNSGLRNSAAYQIARLKGVYPDADFSIIMDTLNKVAKNDQNSLVRVHADLTYAYIKDSQLVTKVKAENPEESMDFYNKLHNELYSSFISVAALQ